jgi:hypothetical protein
MVVDFICNEAMVQGNFAALRKVKKCKIRNVPANQGKNGLA